MRRMSTFRLRATWRRDSGRGTVSATGMSAPSRHLPLSGHDFTAVGDVANDDAQGADPRAVPHANRTHDEGPPTQLDPVSQHRQPGSPADVRARTHSSPDSTLRPDGAVPSDSPGNEDDRDRHRQQEAAADV